MRDRLWRRLESLENRMTRDESVRTIHFMSGNGLPVDATVAIGPANFVCHRHIHEELVDFEIRAQSECPVSRSRPPPILVFTDEEP
jgi:hypothetical protein